MSQQDLEIIDAHIHLYRSLAQLRTVVPRPGMGPGCFVKPAWRDCGRWGTPENTQAFLDRVLISKALCLNLFMSLRQFISSRVAGILYDAEAYETNAEMLHDYGQAIQRHNEWLCSTHATQPRLIPIIGVQKLMGAELMVEEVTLGNSRGARGVKVHPGYHGYYPNDRDMWPLYDICQEMGLPIIADSSLWEKNDCGEPEYFGDVLEQFPRLTLVLAHLGDVFWDERLLLAQRFPNVYFDTSRGFGGPDHISHHPGRDLAEVDAVRVMRKIGIDRIMFGSDGPVEDPVWQIEQILRLELSDAEKDQILGANAKRVFRIQRTAV